MTQKLPNNMKDIIEHICYKTKYENDYLKTLTDDQLKGVKNSFMATSFIGIPRLPQYDQILKRIRSQMRQRQEQKLQQGFFKTIYQKFWGNDGATVVEPIERMEQMEPTEPMEPMEPMEPSLKKEKKA